MTSIDPSAIVVAERSRKALRNLDSLARSINDRGLLHPIVVRIVEGEYVLVAGQRRLEAVKKLGWTSVPVTVAEGVTDELEALYAEGEENTEREPMTPADAVRHADRIRDRIAAEAKERREATQGRPKTGEKFSQDSPPEERKTRTKVAKATGHSFKTIDKAGKILRAVEDVSLPEPVREVAKQAAENLEAPGAKVEREFRSFQAEVARNDPAVANANYRKRLNEAVGKASALAQFPPERVAEVADDDAFYLIDATCKAVAEWHQNITKARGSGLRTITGGKA